MQQLSFLAPRYDSFLKVIHSLRKQKVDSIQLIGDNDLAEKIAAAAQKQGIALDRSTILETKKRKDKSLKATHAILFTETSGELLSVQLLKCVELDGVVVAPITDWHFSRKPLFCISVPKAGTHLVFEMMKVLGYKRGVELPENPLGQTWYCLEYSNTQGRKRAQWCRPNNK